MTEIAIRSNRSKGWFWVDNSAYDQYASKIGAIPFAVYIALCRYADSKTGECFPSIKTIMDNLKITKPTVLKALSALKREGLVIYEHRKSLDGKTNLANLYILCELPGVVKDVYQGSQSALPGVVKDVYQGSQSALPGVVKDVYPNKTQDQQDSVEQDSVEPTSPNKVNRSILNVESDSVAGATGEKSTLGKLPMQAKKIQSHMEPICYFLQGVFAGDLGKPTLPDGIKLGSYSRISKDYDYSKSYAPEANAILLKTMQKAGQLYAEWIRIEKPILTWNVGEVTDAIRVLLEMVNRKVEVDWIAPFIENLRVKDKFWRDKQVKLRYMAQYIKAPTTSAKQADQSTWTQQELEAYYLPPKT